LFGEDSRGTCSFDSCSARPHSVDKKFELALYAVLKAAFNNTFYYFFTVTFVAKLLL
jgi:hypothetical protein